MEFGKFCCSEPQNFAIWPMEFGKNFPQKTVGPNFKVDLSRSSKVHDCHAIWKGRCHFLLVINSKLGPISHRFCDMAGFPLNFLPLPSSFNPQFENVPLAVNHWNFACSNFTHMANYSCKKFSLTTYMSITAGR